MQGGGTQLGPTKVSIVARAGELYKVAQVGEDYVLLQKDENKLGRFVLNRAAISSIRWYSGPSYHVQNALVPITRGDTGTDDKLRADPRADELPNRRPNSEPSGPSPVIMSASLNKDGGLQMTAHTAVLKRAFNRDGDVIGIPGSKSTTWSTSLNKVEAYTTSWKPIPIKELQKRLEARQLVIVSMNEGIVDSDYLQLFKEDTIVLRFKDVRTLMRVTMPEYEPGAPKEITTTR
jgi:hypothetical protein